MKSKQIVSMIFLILVSTLVSQSMQLVYADDNSTENSASTITHSNTTSTLSSTTSSKIDEHRSIVGQKIAEQRANVDEKIKNKTP